MGGLEGKLLRQCRREEKGVGGKEGSGKNPELLSKKKGGKKLSKNKGPRGEKRKRDLENTTKVPT